jgi:hypothetical protein
MLQTVTVDAVMAAEPCHEYPRERVEALVGDGLTPREVAGLDIPVEDRLWTLIFIVLDDRSRRELACDCVERALQRERAAGREPDACSWEAVAVARCHARGEASGAELTAARAAAWAAAWDAAWATAWDAAEVAEREWQLARALEYAEGTPCARP